MLLQVWLPLYMPISRGDKTKLKELGQKLKSIRLAKGMTLKEPGYAIDKEPQSISRVEQGELNPTYLYLLKVCEGLEISLAELFA